jgi:hypothetical protein
LKEKKPHGMRGWMNISCTRTRKGSIIEGVLCYDARIRPLFEEEESWEGT